MVMGEQTTSGAGDATRRALVHMIVGFRVTQMIYVATKLGLIERLAAGPQTHGDLAREAGAHPDALRRLLRALVNVGVFAEEDDGRFGLTPMGAFLRREAPGSLEAMALYEGDTGYRLWQGLEHSVRTGETVFDRIFGAMSFDYYAQNREAGAIFDRFMTSLSAGMILSVVEAYDFSPYRTIVDVGGGHGSFLAAILRATPEARGVLFDVAPVVEGARANLEAAGLGDRCEFVAGDFFEAVPAGGDAYVLKWIMHDWDDERARRILANCRRAMAPHARVLVVDRVMPESMRPGVLLPGTDVNMLVTTGGRERTEAEFRTLYESAGLTLTRVVSTAGELCVVEGAPA